jgi:hypothetical protein
MRKSIVIAAMLVASTAVQAQDYRQATRDAQRQSWENAGMGIALGAAGALVGAAVNNIIQPRQPSYAAPGQPGYSVQGQPGYAAPAPGYAVPPPVVNPYYYPQAQACVTQRAPVYDAYGRVTEFIQYCANPPGR